MPKNDNPHALRFLSSVVNHDGRQVGEQFSSEHPLGKSAAPNKKFEWVKEVCAFLNERYDDETVKAIRMDCACGPGKGQCVKMKAIYGKDKDPYVFVGTSTG